MIVLLLFAARPVKAQLYIMPDRVVVAGFVFDSDTREPIPYVNVYVKKSRKGTITEDDGFFVLYAEMGDTVIFSSIAYQRFVVKVHDSISDIKDPAIVLLKPQIYELASVDVIALKRYQQFKYDFITMELPDDEMVYAIRNLPEMPAELAYYRRSGAEGFGLVMSPISALYDMFSKEGKARRKLEELEREDALRERIETKYSVEIVSSITGANANQANEFMKWCAFSNRLVLSLGEYELIELIIRQYDKFLSRPDSD